MNSNTIYNNLTPLSEIYQPEYPKNPRDFPELSERFSSKEDLQKRIDKVHGGGKFSVLQEDILGKGTSIKIECRNHGIFYTTKEKIVRFNKRTATGYVGSCPMCSKIISDHKRYQEKVSLVSEKIKELHGDRISFKNEDFKGMGTKMVFTCKEHGDFLYYPNKIISYNGCRLCESPFIDPDFFISESNKKFNSKFDYSKVYGTSIESYKSSEITCKEHNHTFFISRYDHYHNIHGGCGLCAKESARDRMIIDFEKFLHRIPSTFGDQFSYYEDSYSTFKTEKMWILCNTHQVSFKIIPKHHINAVDTGGCPECRREHLEKINRKPQSQFIEECKSAHGDRYDYSKVDYISNKIPVTIICPDHGEFIQDPWSHLSGRGCPTCGGYSFWGSRVDTTIDAYVYLMIISGKTEDFFKIGVSMTPIKRAKEIKASSGGEYNVEIFSAIRGNAKELHSFEKMLHTLLNKYKYMPSKKFGGFTECFDIRGISWVSDLFSEHGDIL